MSQENLIQQQQQQHHQPQQSQQFPPYNQQVNKQYQSTQSNTTSTLNNDLLKQATSMPAATQTNTQMSSTNLNKLETAGIIGTGLPVSNQVQVSQNVQLINSNLNSNNNTNCNNSSNNESGDETEEENEVVEESPEGGRWSKRNQLVAQRDVPGIDKAYLAMDTENGYEVVWNEIILTGGKKFKNINNINNDEKKINEIFKSLIKLNHPNIVKFHHYWLDKNEKELKRIIFITEYMSSGSLKQFLRKAKKTNQSIKKSTWKRWCIQLLVALHYLHKSDPPTIHDDLTCDTIYIQHNGLIKIGSIAPDIVNNHVKTCVDISKYLKNMHYIAPETRGDSNGYEQIFNNNENNNSTSSQTQTSTNCNNNSNPSTSSLTSQQQQSTQQPTTININSNNKTTAIDIYAFGMVALEMFNLEFGGNGDTHPITSELIKQSIEALEDTKQKDFILKCLETDPSKRPTAKQLLFHPLLFEVPSLRLLASHQLIKNQNESREANQERLFSTLTRTPDTVLAVKRNNNNTSEQNEFKYSQLTAFDVNRYLEDVKNGIYPLTAFGLDNQLKLNQQQLQKQTQSPKQFQQDEDVNIIEPTSEAKINELSKNNEVLHHQLNKQDEMISSTTFTNSNNNNTSSNLNIIDMVNNANSLSSNGSSSYIDSSNIQSGNTSYYLSSSSNSSPSSTSPSQSLSLLNIQAQQQQQIQSNNLPHGNDAILHPVSTQTFQPNVFMSQDGLIITNCIDGLNSNQLDLDNNTEMVINFNNILNQTSSTNSSTAPTPTPIQQQQYHQQFQQQLIYQQQIAAQSQQQPVYQTQQAQLNQKHTSSSPTQLISNPTNTNTANASIYQDNTNYNGLVNGNNQLLNNITSTSANSSHNNSNNNNGNLSGSQSPILNNLSNNNISNNNLNNANTISNGAILNNLLNNLNNTKNSINNTNNSNNSLVLGDIINSNNHINNNSSIGLNETNGTVSNTISNVSNFEKRQAQKMNSNLVLEKNLYTLTLTITYDDKTARFIKSHINKTDTVNKLAEDLISYGLVNEMDKKSLYETLAETLNKYELIEQADNTYSQANTTALL